MFLYIFLLKERALYDIDIDGAMIFGLFPVCGFSREMSRIVSSEFRVLSSEFKAQDSRFGGSKVNLILALRL